MASMMFASEIAALPKIGVQVRRHVPGPPFKSQTGQRAAHCICGCGLNADVQSNPLHIGHFRRLAPDTKCCGTGGNRLLPLGRVPAQVLQKHRKNFLEASGLRRAPVNTVQNDGLAAFAGSGLWLWWNQWLALCGHLFPDLFPYTKFQPIIQCNLLFYNVSSCLTK